MFKLITISGTEYDVESPASQSLLNILNKKTLVLDLDGCVRQAKDRLHLIPTEEERLKAYQEGNANAAWTKFNDASDLDTPLWGNISVANKFYGDHAVMILTSCTYSQRAAEILKKQLKEWGVKFDMIFMRHPDNHLEPVNMKEVFIKSLTEIVEPSNIVCIDDCEKNNAMFRSHGCTAIKVYYN